MLKCSVDNNSNRMTCPLSSVVIVRRCFVRERDANAADAAVSREMMRTSDVQIGFSGGRRQRRLITDCFSTAAHSVLRVLRAWDTRLSYRAVAGCCCCCWGRVWLMWCDGDELTDEDDRRQWAVNCPVPLHAPVRAAVLCCASSVAKNDRQASLVYVRKDVEDREKSWEKMLNAIAIFVGTVFNILQRLSVIVCCFCAVRQIRTVMWQP